MPVILQPPLCPDDGNPGGSRPPRRRRGRGTSGPPAPDGAGPAPRAAKCRSRRGPAWFALVVWAVVAVGGFALGSAVFGRLDPAVGIVPGSESDRAAATLERLDNAAGAGSETITAVVSGRPADDTRFAEQVRAAADRVRALPGVASVADPYTAPDALPPARDGRAVLIRVDISSRDGMPDSLDTAQQAAAILAGIDAPSVQVGGGPLLDHEMEAQAERDLSKAELISLPVVVILLLIVFGGVVAAGLPLAVALVGIASTFLVLFGFSLVTDVSVYAVQVTTMLGLGLAVDYALLIVTRFREELADGDGTVDSAVRRTAATAGRTVLVSGLTVSAGLAGLLVFPDPFLRGIGMAGAAVVAIDMIAALTLLPALLRLFGHRISPAKRTAREGRVFARAARLVGKRPVLVLTLLAAALAVLALPAAGMRLSGGDARSLPESSASRQVYEKVRDDFGAQYVADPVTVLVRADGPGAATGAGPDTRALAADLAKVPGVVEVGERRMPDGTAVFTVRAGLPAGTASDGPAAQRVVRDIRDLRGSGAHAALDIEVTGPAARLVDYDAMLGDRLPYAVGLIVLATLVLLFAFTGSVLLPLKAVLSNVLSVGAALGVVVWVFQDGHFGQGLGAVDSTAPVLIAAIAFGLSMDYEVFLLSAIREEWLAGGEPRAAVAKGLQRSGRVVTGAALLLVVVFAAFTTGGFSPIRQIGLGLTLAIVLDATVVRMLAVPAAMTLLGRAAWWAPGPLRRLHGKYGFTEGASQSGGPAQADAKAAEPAWEASGTAGAGSGEISGPVREPSGVGGPS
ncbi:MMPL family transporter [Yinghuangia soli]|uniref:MMPL family transporter n=1 Tax=Yinghuangia soli TaxID=2908204 RepID=A0AA41Q1C3_9ACTN|nr:MMPL family transporter [Yinghuangia soli]MCF2529145.1 MMPL family transporter [Yinghuangia soli]